MAGKVRLQLIKNTTRRRVTCNKRKRGLVKKARELSILCDINVLVIIISQTGAIDAWPNDDARQAADIIARYRGLGQADRGKYKQDLIAYLLTKIGEKRRDSDINNMADVAEKASSRLEEIRRRIQFLTDNRDRKTEEKTHAMLV